ncbi:hypothetical protein QUF74_12190 [Candidatus Halobeggiatoa sp. HSG11]|nr:hypothetical protein [Candidatus Halobeggiatoa sp. HSG11]
MKKVFILLALFVIVSVTNAVEVDFSAAELSMNDDNTIVFDGVRVEGFGFSLEKDALKLKYKFDPDTLNFKLDMDNYVPYMGIGIFNGQCMVNDAPVTSVTTDDDGQEVESRQPFYTTNAETSYKKDEEEFIIAAGDLIEAGKSSYRFLVSPDAPFIAEFDLKLNQVMSWYVNRFTKNINYQLVGPEVQTEAGTTEPGEIIDSGELERSEQLLLGPIRVIKAGIYKLKISLAPKQKDTSFVFKAFNGNNKTLKKVVNNTRLSEFFENDTFSCSKFQISLNRNEILTVPASENNDLVLKLINSKSKVIAQVTGNSDLVYKELDKNNDYYLFVYSKASKRATYSKKITIVLEKPEETTD